SSIAFQSWALSWDFATPARVQSATIAVTSPRNFTLSLLLDLGCLAVDHAAHRRGGDADVAGPADTGAIAHLEAIAARHQREASQGRRLPAAPFAGRDHTRTVQLTVLVAHLHQTSDDALGPGHLHRHGRPLLGELRIAQ